MSQKPPPPPTPIVAKNEKIASLIGQTDHLTRLEPSMHKEVARLRIRKPTDAPVSEEEQLQRLRIDLAQFKAPPPPKKRTALIVSMLLIFVAAIAATVYVFIRH